MELKNFVREHNLIIKGASVLMTLAFMSVVRPDNPTMFGVSLVAIMLYECLRWGIEYCIEIKKQSDMWKKMSKKLKVREQMRKDMRNVSATRIGRRKAS